MKKLFILLILITGTIFAAEPLVKDHAYIVSSINKSETVEAGESFSLVPQVVVATGNEKYIGSVSTFTGCYGGKRYEASVEVGNCLISVIDSLNSDSRTDALSAYQGKILNEKVTSLESNLYNQNLLPTGIPSLAGDIWVGWDNDEQYYVASGTNKSNGDVYYNITRYLELTPGETYKILGIPDNQVKLEVRLAREPGAIAAAYPLQEGENFSDTFVYTEPIWVYVVFPPGFQANNYIIKPAITKNLSMNYENYVSYEDSFAKVGQTLKLEYIGNGVDSGENAREPYFDFADLPYGAYLVVNTNANTANSIAAITMVTYTPYGLFYANVPATRWVGSDFFRDNGTVLYGKSVSWGANLKVWKIGLF